MFNPDDIMLYLDIETIIRPDIPLGRRAKMVKLLNDLLSKKPNLYLMFMTVNRTKRQVIQILTAYNFNYTNRIMGIIKPIGKDILNHLKNYDISRLIVVTPNVQLLQDPRFKTNVICADSLSDGIMFNVYQHLKIEIHPAFNWRNEVRILMKEQGETWASLAKKMGHDPSNLRKQILYKNPTLLSLQSLFDALGYDLKMYIKKKEK